MTTYKRGHWISKSRTVKWITGNVTAWAPRRCLDYSFPLTNLTALTLQVVTPIPVMPGSLLALQQGKHSKQRSDRQKYICDSSPRKIKQPALVCSPTAQPSARVGRHHSWKETQLNASIRNYFASVWPNAVTLVKIKRHNLMLLLAFPSLLFSQCCVSKYTT